MPLPATLPRSPSGSRRSSTCCGALLLIASLLASGCQAPGATGKVLRGHLSMGPDGEQFLPCGSEQALRLQANAALAEHLRSQYLAQVGEPYEEAFVRLRGHPERAGDEADLRVEQVLELHPAAAQDCH